MTKVDLKRDIASYRAKAGRFDVIEVPELSYLMIDGHGDPNTSTSYREALETLYPVAYRLKFFSKRELDRDYVVMPLEALWWSESFAAFTTARDKSQWHWTAMIMTPEWITRDDVDNIVRELGEKIPAPDRVRFETVHEGLVVQTLHIGPYDDEGPVLEELHERFIPGNGLRMTGKHHEIYLSDPRRTAPEKLRTILRQPVVRADS